MSLAALRQQLAAVIAPQLPSGAGDGVSTGIAALDAALSDGGLPCGRLTEIVGQRGSGKTTLVREIVAQALADKRWVAYIDAGRTLAPADWASLAASGRLWIVRPPPPPPPPPLPTSASPSRAAGRRSDGSSPPSPSPRQGERSAEPSSASPRQGERSAEPSSGASPGGTEERSPVAHGAWCADVLLRSGAFGLVVLDGGGALAPGRGDPPHAAGAREPCRLRGAARG